ncbi:MAG: Arginine biosynthesis bifunctional protein ArgJ [Syntrophorhabdus sp. PtaU1.Bin050]|nr:MAG: Arginine biosynthesis bifunctional protein ArgJ [Syntrophorhabdus sp. PtaU1.Bin050]
MIPGVKFAGIASGIKASGLDLGLVVFDQPTYVTALYTKNKVKAAHILYNKKVTNPVRAILANSGCANACTGLEGTKDLKALSETLSGALHIEDGKVLFASTGVIGRRLPTETMATAIPGLVKGLKENQEESFARSIMTTDTYPKIVRETIPGKKAYTIVGIAKGSGMINPLLATMLVFIFTDYPVSPETIRKTLLQGARESFERISVDGECSTNDSVFLFTRQGPEDLDGLQAFRDKLFSVMKELSMMLVRDGEGATRVIHITVNGAKKKETAEKIARRIAISPLTKTAFFGCDPNWGRIIAAVGDSNVAVRPSRVEIILQGEVLARNGIEVPFDEEKIKKLMNKKEVDLIVNLGDGRASYDMYTTDLTFDYVKINASYRS